MLGKEKDDLIVVNLASMTRFGTLNGDLGAAQVVKVLAQALAGVVATNARVIVHTIDRLGLLFDVCKDKVFRLGIVSAACAGCGYIPGRLGLTGEVVCLSKVEGCRGGRSDW
jgi:hypothetical protein